MTEQPGDAIPIAMPRTRTALYSQAQVKATRYWDFSASRQEVLGQFGYRERPRTDASPTIPELPPPQQATPHRWYALHSVLFPIQAPPEDTHAVETQEIQSPPVIAVLSAAGGVGKTCLVATLGRALSSLAEQVLLVDMSAFGLLPFYFASREVKPGVVRTFSSPLQPGQNDAPVRLLSLDAERSTPATGDPDPLVRQLVQTARGASRVLVDVGTAQRGLPGRLLPLRPILVVPILPDMSSLARLSSLQAMAEGGPELLYLLNQFDASLPLHVDVRAMLQQQLGSQLLPLVLHRSAAVSEALAEGMTVIDYAPGSEVAEDYRQLAAWLRSLAAPATASYVGMRWTER